MKNPEFKKGRVTLRLVSKDEKLRELELRLEVYWNRFKEMSTKEKRNAVRELFVHLYKSQKQTKELIRALLSHHQNEIEIERTLRMIGKRMRG
ncbi:hypothetical protein LEP1GSC036_2251 [Leptospira weilii str. 2006001853]|uniref:Uncharacterized protein n=1 Tax=Leptospira weilii str. 2006001853 TaxID=1001589 RepID=A0A828YXF5_9LEPT|nr:hypothetical protein [Leptospira weilii]EKR62784.1 hypothetical protein LEP1GSC036_2251 [Leptospira weilii str. 2006001853]